MNDGCSVTLGRFSCSNNFDKLIEKLRMPRRAASPPPHASLAGSRSWLVGTGLQLWIGLRKAAIGAVVAACVGLPAWILGGRPSFQDTRRFVQSLGSKPASDTLFTVLLADLAGDDDKQTETIRLARAIEANGTVEVVLLGRKLDPGTVGSLREGDQAVGETARHWLEKRNGDLLIWGQVFEKSLLLAFVPRGGVINRPSGYSSIGEQIELPRDVKAAFEEQVQAIVFSLVDPATAARGQFLATRLQPVAIKLRNLMKHRGSFSPEIQTGIAFSFGLAAYTIGEQTGSVEWLEESVDAYGVALQGRPRELAPTAWAWINMNLGAALYALGSQGDSSRLLEAASAFRSALQENTKQSVPYDWAAAESSLGVTLAMLGELRADTVTLRQAVTAHRAVLEVYTGAGAPLEALAQTNLGAALASLGELQSDAGLIAEAVDNFRAALEIRTRERVPLDWAATQMNLGHALAMLGTAQEDPAPLEEATSAYRLALQEYTRDRMPREWSTTMNGMGISLHQLGRIRNDPKELEEAIDAYRSALQERTRERNPRNWAATQRNLGLALTELGKMRGSSDQVHAAIGAYQSASEGYLQAGDSARARWAQENLEAARATVDSRN